jgi:hypothetical protein
MSFLSRLELQDRGDRRGLLAIDAETKQPNLLSFVWVDRDRRYFISTVSSLAEGTPFVRNRLRQVVEDNFTAPENVELSIPQPRAAEIYYSCCAKIDQHNRHRQDTLMLEHKIRTKDWSLRVNLSLLSMILVDTWKVWSMITLKMSGEPVETQKQFYGRLATELIDNCFDRATDNRRRQQSSPTDCELIDHRTNLPRSGTSIHLTPTKRKRKNKDGDFTSYTFQGRCMVCKQKTRFQCSRCKDEATDKDEGWLCHTVNGKMCFVEHLREYHIE